MSNAVSFTIEKGDPITEPTTEEPTTTTETTTTAITKATTSTTKATTTTTKTTTTTTTTTTEEQISDTRPTTTTTTPPTSDRLYGDATDDGEIDIMDVIALNKYLLGTGKLTNTGKKNSDTNADGYLDTTDSLIILKIVVEILAPKDLPVK